MAWAVAVGMPVIEWVADRAAGGIYQPGDANFRVRPEFSVAEAHVKAGRYAEAIAQFRRDAEKFPDEAVPYVRIADLQLEHLHDPDAAIAELQTALTKAQGPDAVALIGNRLADLLLRHRHDHAAAMECYRAIQHRCPGTKHARHAADRAACLLAA
jgi:tetratricopeptide (TPR) repeat protein